MKYSAVALAAAAGSAAAQQPAYGQCGGSSWTGATSCVAGYHCISQNPFYYQCVPGAATSAAATKTTSKQAHTTLSTSAKTTTTTAVVRTTYSSAKTTTTSSKATTTTTKATTTTTKAAATTTTTVAKASTTTSKAAVTTSASSSSGKVKYAGVNISGFDFGCGTDGTCATSSVLDPGTAGANQMNHFVSQTGLNAFRLPVAWQYLVNNKLGGTLDATNLATYDVTVQNCIKSGAALCIIDIHNYARWNGAIIGQSSGSVANTDFSSLWSQLATKYASSSTVAFGLMNEPHDVPDITAWAATVQTAVTAIRQAGAKSNMILLPGNDWTHAASSISDGSYAALSAVKNLDSTTTNLVFDLHQYLDSDGSGTHADCTTNNVAAFTTLAARLRSDGRQGLLSETGGGPTDSSCLTDVCQQLEYLAKNSDVYLGWTGWGAGMFDTSYVLAETPNGSAGSYSDQTLVSQCIAGAFKGTATA